LLSSSEHSGVLEDSKPPTFPSVRLHPHTWPKWGCDRKIAKRDVLCLLDTWASHNFIIRECVKRMELHLEELKAPIEVHFADGVPHPTTFQAKEVPL